MAGRKGKGRFGMSRRDYANAIVENACRWCQNILVEVLGSHGEYVPSGVRDCLHRVTDILAVEIPAAMRKGERDGS